LLEQPWVHGAQQRAALQTVWVCVPTYNEAENIEPLVRALLGVFDDHDLDGRVLVIDDASPDGTGDIADPLAAQDARVDVLHRATKEGLGRAYRDGFRRALLAGAGLVVQMDCDFSHSPEAVPDLVRASGNADVVIGSRYAGGSTAGWGVVRKAISRGGCGYARRVLGIDVRDLTGGFKCFRRRALAYLLACDVDARGYGFQVQMTYLAHRAGFSVQEVPIVFRDRERGTSKMSTSIVVEAALMVPRLRLDVQRRLPSTGETPAIAVAS
jgi:dolichol-phosphate mannosyltransferase